MIKQNKGLIIFLMLALLAGGAYVYKQSVMKTSSETNANVYYCPMHPTYQANRAGDCPICQMALVKKENHTHSSTSSSDSSVETGGLRTMTLQELMSLKPGEVCLLHKCKMGKCMMVLTEELARVGKCPHCGEDLGVTIVEAAPEGYTALNLDQEKQEAIGIKTAEVKRMNMTKTIRTVGRIAYDPALYQAQEEYLQAARAKAKAAKVAPEIEVQAGRLLESSRIKLRLLGLNEELISDLEKAGKADRSLLYPDEGGSVWLYVPIYEYELPYVKKGDQLQAEAPGLPAKTFTGQIRAIDSVLDPVTRSARVRAVLENKEGALKPEMYVNAMIHVDLGERLAVPEEAVFMTGEKNIVFVAKSKGVFEPREVTLGAVTEHFREVASGLSEGDMVVTSGNFLIDSESRLKAALENVGGLGGHQHGG